MSRDMPAERPGGGRFTGVFFWGGRGRRTYRVALALGAVATAAALSGCESTQQRSAELRRAAKHELLATQGVSVTKENPSVRVVQSGVVHTSEGTAVVVGLRNTSPHTLVQAPIEIVVHDAHGAVVFKNDQPGIEPSLAGVSLLPAGTETIWVDDQVQATGAPASVTALVGEATDASGTIPQMTVTGAHLTSEAGSPTTLSGSVTNQSKVAQQNLVVYAVGRHGSTLVAAGRAVLPEVLPDTSVPFQVYFVGNPNGAQIQTSAPATTF